MILVSVSKRLQSHNHTEMNKAKIQVHINFLLFIITQTHNCTAHYIHVPSYTSDVLKEL